MSILAVQHNLSTVKSREMDFSLACVFDPEYTANKQTPLPLH